MPPLKTILTAVLEFVVFIMALFGTCAAINLIPLLARHG